jgi:transcription antitermination factor NusG
MWKMNLPSKDGEALSEMQTLAMAAQNAGIFCDAADTSLQWFAAFTTPRHEKSVSELLVERQIEAFLPLYRKATQWKKSRPVVLELPLFPTYVFVRIPRRARGSVLSLPGVHSIVGSSKAPWPIPDGEIENLRRGMQTHKAEPCPYLKVGERVRVKTGLMAGVEGFLIRKKNEFRMVITLDLIMQSMSVEVDGDNLESIDQDSEKLTSLLGCASLCMRSA